MSGMIINRIDDNVKGGLLMLSCLTFIEEQDMTTSPMFRFYCTARFVGMIINRVDDNVKGGFVIRVSCLATIEDWGLGHNKKSHVVQFCPPILLQRKIVSRLGVIMCNLLKVPSKKSQFLFRMAELLHLYILAVPALNKISFCSIPFYIFCLFDTVILQHVNTPFLLNCSNYKSK